MPKDDRIPDEEDLDVPAPDPDLPGKVEERLADPTAAEQIRAAADSLDDARTDLRYGDLDIDGAEIEEIVLRIDGQLSELEDTLRQVAILAEVNEEGEDAESD